MSSLAIPNFRRAWKISLATQSAGTVELSSDQFTEPLHVEFSIETRALIAYWTASLSIYNVNAALGNVLTSTGVPPDKLWKFNQPIQYGDSLSISAGYRFGSGGAFDPDANLVWKGNVLQPLWTRENVVDYKIILRCLLGLLQDVLNAPHASDSGKPGSKPGGLTVAAGASDYDKLLSIALASNIPLDSNNIDVTALQNSKAGKATVLMGRPFPLIDQIARDNKLQVWMGFNGLNLRSLKFDPNQIPAYAYGPPNLPGNYAPRGTTTGIIKKTLIGVPVQTQQGVSFRVLLDALPKIGDIVQLAPNTVINKLPLNIGSFPAILDSGGVYVIGGIRHVGDTRGNDWYTEITGFTANFFPDFLAQGAVNNTGG